MVHPIGEQHAHMRTPKGFRHIFAQEEAWRVDSTLPGTPRVRRQRHAWMATKYGRRGARLRQAVCRSSALTIAQLPRKDEGATEHLRDPKEAPQQATDVSRLIRGHVPCKHKPTVKGMVNLESRVQQRRRRGL